MRIETVSVTNLRCIKESVAHLDPYTCFVGPNGAGKSTVLCALNIFFRNVESAPTDVASLIAQDFHLQDTGKPIDITVTFRDLSEEAKRDFKDYFRQGKLVVSATAHFNPQTGKAEVKQYGQRLGMTSLKPFFEAYGDQALVPQLKILLAELENNDPEIAALKLKTTKEAMSEGLKKYEASKPDKCVLIPSEDQFYGVSKGANRLAKYIQWIYIPAVKDASEEESGTKTSALGKLLSRTISAKLTFVSDIEQLLGDARLRYKKILDDNQPALDSISKSLAGRLSEWAHPLTTLRVVWENDSTKAVNVTPPLAGVLAGESGFEGKLARLGHGFQRSFLLALLQELASSDDKNAPTLILGCEEPELYQHPPQARHLAETFERLSTQGSQILVTTHSPYFVSGEHFESIRMVRRTPENNCSSIRQYTFDELGKKYAALTNSPLRNASAYSAKLHQALQPSLGEMFFTQRLVLVEGLEDLAYIQAWMVLSGRWEAFRRSGAHIVPTNGKSELVRPAIIARGLEIPILVVYDSDGDKLTKLDHTGTQIDNPQARINHERDNRALVRLFDGDESQLFPTAPIWLDGLVAWPGDLASTIKGEFVESLGPQGATQFDAFKSLACKDAGNAGDLGKNLIYIGYLLGRIWDANGRSVSLERLCEKIIQIPT